MRAGELCAGYGGLALAVEEVFGAATAWFSELDPAPSKILKHHWPDVPNQGDMTQIDWAAIEQVDIISGGTPCQDLSAAGRRAGMTEGTRSNLWVQMREAIATQRPRYVVWENVRGAFSAKANSEMEHCPRCMGEASNRGHGLRALGRVLGDLSDLGFDAEWRGVRASDIGACHQRYRVFVLARLATPNTGRAAFGELSREPLEEEAWKESRNGPSDHRREQPPSLRWEASTDALSMHSERRGDNRDLAGQTGAGEADSIEWQRHGNPVNGSQPANPRGESITWGAYEPAIRQWEDITQRRAPRPTEPTGRSGAERLSPRFTEWMMGLPDGWVTDPAIGISRNEQLKACGNGVVPQQAIAALRDMLAAFESRELAA